MITRFVPVALLLSACAPQNAVLSSGQYFGFVSDNTSFSLSKEALDPYDYEKDMWTIDCRNFIDNREKKVLQLTGIADDCEGESNDNRCQDRRLKQLCNDWTESVPETDPEQFRPVHETWLAQSPWWVVTEQLEPWRGEAVITAEEDLQIGFHHRLPGGADFRFAFAIDPTFAPQQCNIESGEPEPRDGDWVAEWSDPNGEIVEQIKNTAGLEHLAKYVDGGSVYLLNADGFQFNPDDTLDYWFMPEQWEAGFGGGRFAEEGFQSRSPRWGLNEVYEYFEVFDPGEGYAVPPRLSELYFCELEEDEKPEDNQCIQDMIAEFQDEIMPSIQSDLNKALSPEGADNQWSPVYTTNLWRTGDGTKAGFDGWGELHYNIVVFDQSPEQMRKLEKGSAFKGAFTLMLDGLDSNSRFLVKGEFEVTKLKLDKWTTTDLRAEKLEENGNSLCVLQ